VLDSKTGRITPLDIPLQPFDNRAVMANRKFTCRYAWSPNLDSSSDMESTALKHRPL
jgi:hypothetical protein